MKHTNINEGGMDALDTSAIKFDIALEPLQTANGLAIDYSTRRAVVDKTNNRVVGTCGKHYKPTAYYQIADRVNLGLMKSNLDLSDITVIDNLYDGGAKWHRKIQFNKIEKSLAKKDDIIKLELNIHSSLDLSRKISSIFGAIRLWCLNGCVTSDYNVARHFKQTLGLNSNWLADNSVSALVNFENNKLMFDKMLATSVSDEDVAKFFRDTIAKLSKPTGNAVDGFVYHSKDKLTSLMNRYAKEVRLCGGSNLWSVYNTLTNYSTHVSNQDWTGTTVNEKGKVVKADLVGAKHNVIYNRELAVAKSLNHELFKQVA
tara:strand:- start:209 stop:1156 length:948 start_codon:yes stop_codon:yes gene_type:complete